MQQNVTGHAGAEAPAQATGRAAGSEPDYRFTLATERTFLAWFRTALALIAGGVAVVQLVPALALPGARQVLGMLLTVAGGGLSLAAVLRWSRVQAAMRREEDLPPTRVPVILGLGLAALTAFVVVLLLLSGRSA
ncbi:MAG: rane protein [Modestobacter sp.]|nr:rane protein [Modestobacter sp.]